MTSRTNPVRRVKIIAATYIKGVIAPVDSEHQVLAAMASELVGNGRAIYLDPAHTDVASPPSTDLSPLVSGPAPAAAKSKSYA
jgi:hypothetical protein